VTRAVVILFLATFLGGLPATADEVTPADARAIAQEAAIFGFALVEHYRVVHRCGVDTASPKYAPANTFNHADRFQGPRGAIVASPGNDTLHSTACLDLRAEPVVIDVPPVEDRYYSLRLLDMVSEPFAYIGSRATGPEPGSYVVVGPGWKGDLPPATMVTAIIPAPSWFVLVASRTEAKTEGDIDDAAVVQSGYRLAPLSDYFERSKPPPVAEVMWPAPVDARTSRAREYFSLLGFLMQWQTIQPYEASVMERFARIGLEPGRHFPSERLSPSVRDAIETGLDAGRAQIADHAARMGTTIDGWQIQPGAAGGSGSDYLTRSAIAWDLIHADSPAEVLCAVARTDRSGFGLDGGLAKYTVTFETQPPVEYFWSITLYDAATGQMVPNPVHQYSVGHRKRGLRYNPKGSLTFYIQRKSPGRKKEANWLPAPQGPFYLICRLYGPKPEVLDGSYRIPAVMPER
jgi:hypothetical protein